LLHWHILTAVLCADLRHRYTISESVGGLAGTFRGRRMLVPSVDAAFWPNRVRRVDRLQNEHTTSEFHSVRQYLTLLILTFWYLAPRGNHQENLILNLAEQIFH
jgi:hypothetical protein